MIFPSRSQLASKQIRRTGRAEAVTKEGLAATLLPGRLILASSAVLIVLTFGNLIFGTTVKRLHEKVQVRCLAWLVRRKAAETGLDLSESQ